MRRLDNNDDLIDFPCSDDWLDYYYERGLTDGCVVTGLGKPVCCLRESYTSKSLCKLFIPNFLDCLKG